MPLFSVVIPLYNKENYIKNTLNSVLNQNFTDYEIIVVEDCSTDSSFKMASEVLSDKIRIVKHEKNKGLSASRNTGIKNAKSDYIAFLDADDLWEDNFLSEVNTLIQKFPQAELFATNYWEIYANENHIIPKNNSEKLETHSLIDDFFKSNLSQPFYCLSGLCAKKTIFDLIGLFDETITYGEDVDFNIRANSACKLAYSVKPLVKYYMVSENQITRGKISTKKITDFDKYDTPDTPDTLKRFLDFQRYIMAKHYLLDGNFEKYQKMKKEIEWSNLNYKQQILLNLPRIALICIKKAKDFLISRGIRMTTYD